MEQFPDDQKIIVAGDIKESDPVLIDEVFREINTMAQDLSRQLKFLDMRNLSQDEIYNQVKSALDQGPGRKVVLFKASRAVALDKVIEKFFI